LLTTREVRDAENKMIQLATEGQGKHEALNSGEERVIRNPLVGGSEEQSKAVRHVLGSKDFVISFKGPAGAGKTQLMTEAVTAIEALSGKRVLVLAPSSASVEVLRAQGFTNAETLASSPLRGRVEIWRGSLRAPFPDPAHQTGRADLPHLGFRTRDVNAVAHGNPKVTFA
jgi:hypothetical protein